MTDREKQSLKIRLGRRLSSDRREVMEIVKEEIDKTPKTPTNTDDRSCEDCKFDNRLAAQEPCCYCKYSHFSYFEWKGGAE